MLTPRTFEAFAIINPYGSIWCDETFVSPGAARTFIEKFCPTLNITDFATIPVVVTVTVQTATPATHKTPTPFAPKSNNSAPKG